MKKSIKKILFLGIALSSLNAFANLESGLAQASQLSAMTDRNILLVNSFEITGNNKIDIKDILDKYKIKKGDVFNVEKLKQLINALAETGYYESIVPDIKTSTLTKQVNIVLQLKEQRIINSVKLEGVTVIEPNKLLEEIGLVSGSVFNNKYMNQKESPIIRELLKKGLLLPLILKASMDENNNLTIVVSEGKISSIEFIKNSQKKDNIRLTDRNFNLKTKDFVLERSLAMSKGDYLTVDSIKNSVSNLIRTGAFETVDYSYEIDPTNVDNRVVVFSLKERRTASINASGSYSTSSGMVAEVSLADSNFLGGQQTGKLSASLSTTLSYNFGLSYWNPWIKGTNNLQGGFDISFSRQKLSNSTLKQHLSYRKQDNGKYKEVGINGELAEYIRPNDIKTLSLSGTLGKMLVKNLYLTGTPSFSYKFSTTNRDLKVDSSINLGARTTLSYDSVDNPYLLRSGNKFRLTLSGTYVAKDSSLTPAATDFAKSKLVEIQTKIYDSWDETKKEEYFTSYKNEKDKDGFELTNLKLNSKGEKAFKEALKTEGFDNTYKTAMEGELKKESSKYKPRVYGKVELEYINYTPLIDKINTLATKVFIGKASKGADSGALFQAKGPASLRGLNIATSTDFIMSLQIENRLHFNNYIEGVMFIDSALYAKELDTKTQEGYAQYHSTLGVFKWDYFSKNLKLTAGAGIRVNTPIGIVRLDYGIPLINYNKSEGRGKLEFGLSQAF